VFEVAAWRSACSGASANVKGVVTTFKEVLDHLSEGLRFYMSLQVRVARAVRVCVCVQRRAVLACTHGPCQLPPAHAPRQADLVADHALLPLCPCIARLFAGAAAFVHPHNRRR
jgi:hypothetical protein